MDPLPPIAVLAADLAAGRTSSRALTETALARIADPAGEGARCFTRLWPDAARAEAEAADRRRAAGIAGGPLAGLPMSVKDLFDIAGEPTTAGSRVLADAAPATADAPVVARLRAAGAILLGRTTMTEFAYSGLGLNPHYGTPANPVDPTRIPGGSSSGAGAAVAYGFGVASIGTDTGGSVRIPAAFCGVVGFKPTARRVPRDGAIPLSISLDSVGPLAPTVACCARLDAVLAGEPVLDLPVIPVAGLRLGVVRDRLCDELDATVGRAFERALAMLSAAGALVEEIAAPVFEGFEAFGALGGITGPESFAWHRPLLAERAAGYDPRVRARIEAWSGSRTADYLAAVDLRRAMIARFDRLTYPYDAILAPTVPIVPPGFAELAPDPFRGDEAYHRVNQLVLRNPATFNVLDRCGLSLPMAAPDELPSGLAVIGETLGDRRLLVVGQAIEAALAPLRTA